MFDLEKESTLYIDIAKSNSRYSRSKRSRTGPLLPRWHASHFFASSSVCFVTWKLNNFSFEYQMMKRLDFQIKRLKGLVLFQEVFLILVRFPASLIVQDQVVFSYIKILVFFCSGAYAMLKNIYSS